MTRIKISWAINHTFNHLVLQFKKPLQDTSQGEKKPVLEQDSI